MKQWNWRNVGVVKLISNIYDGAKQLGNWLTSLRERALAYILNRSSVYYYPKRGDSDALETMVKREETVKVVKWRGGFDIAA